MRDGTMFLIALAIALLGGCGSGGGGGEAPAVVAPTASTLPLMGSDRRVGAVYSVPSDGSVRTLTDAAWAESLTAGADTYQLAVTWSDLESAPGVVDTAQLAGLLDIIQSSGLRPYLLIKTIDTVALAIPADLRASSTTFAAGLAFDHATVRSRFRAVLGAVVPLLVSRGGFFLSVANEIDPYLAANPDQRDAFLAFLGDAVGFAHGIDPRLAIGATCTHRVVAGDAALLAAVLARSDAAAFTYYPLDAGFMVEPPSVVGGDLAALVDAAAGKAVLLQEIGYPAGNPSPGNGSSPQLQAQAIEAVFIALAAQPRIRFCSFMHLCDWSAAEVSVYETYYGSSDPRFIEYLATLGMIDRDGARRPAFAAYLAGLHGPGGPG